MNREKQHGFPHSLKAARVLDQLCERIRNLHYSIRMEDAYVNWVRSFIGFYRFKQPAAIGAAEGCKVQWTR
jgi:predicted flavoprotein YhiN